MLEYKTEIKIIPSLQPINKMDEKKRDDIIEKSIAECNAKSLKDRIEIYENRVAQLYSLEEVKNRRTLFYALCRPKGNSGLSAFVEGYLHEKGMYNTDKYSIHINYREATEAYYRGAMEGHDLAQQRLYPCLSKYGESLEKHIRAIQSKESISKEDSDEVSYYYYRLGYAYENGFGIEKDIEKAIEYYRLAMALDRPHAQSALVTVILKKSEHDPQDSYDLARYYHEEEGNFKKAMPYYKLAVDQENADAQFKLGHCYYEGRGVEKDEKEATRLFHLAAEKGNADAQYYLGEFYQRGRNVEKNIQMAIRYYESACGKNWLALYNLAVLYLNGKNVSRDTGKGVKILSETKQFKKEANFALGKFYWHGNYGLQKDRTKGLELIKLAGFQGNEDAKKFVKECVSSSVSSSERVRFRLKQNERQNTPLSENCLIS